MRSVRSSATLVLLFVICVCAFSPKAFTADYPRRVVRLVVPYEAGRPADIVARMLAQKLTDGWGVPMVVDNRPGAGGNLGTDLVAKAAPDGYTLLIGNVGSLAINPALLKNLPYDPVKDFAPITLLVAYPNVLVVNPSGPASVKDLVALARSQPGKLSYGSAGIGSSAHLAAELLKSMAQIDMVHIPFKGGGQAIIEVIADRVTLYFSSVLGALPHMKSGKLRALAVTSAKRSSVVKDMPTVAESGYPGFEVINWLGLLAPARTPAPLVRRLNGDVVRIFQNPDAEQNLIAQGGEPAVGTPDKFATYMRSEIVKWAKVVKDSGVKPE